MAGDLPGDLRYTTSHEWVRRDGDEIQTGITAFAAEELGDVVYIQLPEMGTTVTQGQSYGEIESVKAVSDIYAPVSGEVISINTELDANPGTINDDPYGNGWIARIRLENPDEYDSLLDAAAYEQSTKESH